jgi:hypothetical protein
MFTPGRMAWMLAVLLTLSPFAVTALAQSGGEIETPLIEGDLPGLRQKAMSLLQGEQYLEAIEAFELILSRFPAETNALYNTACAYSLLGKRGEAMAFLRLAVDAGFEDLGHISADPDLDAIREEAGYLELVLDLKEREIVTFEAEVMPETATDYLPPGEDSLEPPVRETGSRLMSGASATGAISWGRGSLWLRIGGGIVTLDPVDGSLGESPKPDPEGSGGFAFDGDHLWTVGDGAVSRYSLNDGQAARAWGLPVEAPVGVAMVGGILLVGDPAAGRLYGIDPESGEVVTDIPAPSPSVTALAAWGEYILVAAADEMAVHVITLDGYVIMTIPLGARPLTIASDGELFWVIDEHGKLREFRIDRERKFYLSRGLVTTITYVAGHGPDGHIAVPWNMNRQKIGGKVEISPASDVVRDRWGQPAVKSRALRVTAELHDIRYTIWPDMVGGLEDIPAAILERYLVDGEMLRTGDPAIEEGARWITRDGAEIDRYRLLQRAYEYVTERTYYQKIPGWPSAPEILGKGTGTCSPLSFLFVSLCRASGIPARFQAGTRASIGGDDREFHRWSEVYLPGYGWIPVDSSAVGKDPNPARRAVFFGHIPANALVMTLGGGGSELFGWGYNATESGVARWRAVE